MFEEMLDEVVCESEYEVALSMFNAYCKYFTMEAYGTNADTDIVFTEAETPKRETLLQKIIWFIPDLIMKFINFIKKKLGKLDEKPQEEIEHNVVANIQVMKQDKSKEKKVAAGLAAGGLALAATATGYIIYNKKKNGSNKQNNTSTSNKKNGENVMSISVVDDTVEITIEGSLKNNIKNIKEVIPSIINIIDELMKVYNASDSSAYQEKYESILKKVKEETAKLTETLSAGKDTEVYHVNELLSMMKEVDNDCNNIAKQVKLIKHKPDLTNTDVKYDQTTTDLKTAISDMLYKIELVISAVSNQLSSLSTALYYFSESPLSHESYRRDSANKDLSFLKTVVTYGSYKGSAFGDTFGAISSSDFNDVYGFSRPTSVDKFEKLGKIGEILRRVMTGSELVDPVWGCISGDYFVTTPTAVTDQTWGVMEENSKRRYPDTNEHYTSSFKYAFILNDPEIFSRIADAINISPALYFNNEAKSVIDIGEKFSDDDNKGIFVDSNALAKTLYQLRTSGKKLPDILMPGNDEIIVRLKNPEKANELYNEFNEFGSDVKVTKIKSQSKGYFKIYLDGKKSKDDNGASNPSNDETISKS